MDRLEKISFFKIILILGVLHFFLLSFNLYVSFVLFSFFVSIYISYAFKNKSSLVIHWINPFLILHNQSFVLYRLLIFGNVEYELEFEILLMSFISFYSFNIIYILFLTSNKSFNLNLKVNRFIYRFLWAFTGLGLMFYLYLILATQGLNSKRDVANFLLANSSLGYLYALSGLFLTLVFYDLLSSRYRGRTTKSKIIVYGSFFSLIFLILGERELLFTYIIGLIFLFSYYRKKFLIWIYYCFILLILFVAPYTSLLKSIFISGNSIDLNETSFEERGFDDFMTVGTNIIRVYERNGLTPVTSKNLILDDIGNLFGLSLNSARWYNLEFLGRGLDMTGYGFSLQLTGFLDISYLGIFVIYSLLAFIVSLIYNLFSKSYLGLSFLISLIYLIVYIQRQDFAYFLNIFVKLMLIPYILMVKIKFLDNDRKREI